MDFTPKEDPKEVREQKGNRNGQWKTNRMLRQIFFFLQKVSKKSKAKIVSCNKYQKCFVKTKSFEKICTLSILIVSIYLFFLCGVPCRINY